MSDQTTSLIFKIDSTSAKTAETNLDGMESASKRAEAAARGMGAASNAAAAAASSLAAAARQIAEMMAAVTNAGKQAGTAIDGVTSGSNRAVTAQSGLAAAAMSGAQAQNAFGLALNSVRATMTTLPGAYSQASAAAQGFKQATSSAAAATTAATTSATGLAAAAKHAAASTKSIGMSAAQTANNLRMLPAQITDITVGLSTGQSPFTVLLQQGGQLKDMFGGIGPAARAVGGYVAGLINPFTLAATGAAFLATAYHQGSEESTRYNEALALTGNYAGLTVDQLGEMARRMSDTVGSTGKAADALAQIISTGKFTGRAIEDIGRAAVAMERATGQSVEDTIKQFVQLGEKPSEASAKLNEQYHYLTASVYEQIKALEDQGKTEQAQALAQQTFAKATQERAAEVMASMGTLERSWNSLGDAARTAWNYMLNIGRPTPVSELRAQAKVLQDQIDSINSTTGFSETGEGAVTGRGSSGRIGQLRRLREELGPLLAAISGEEKKESDARESALAAAAAQTKIRNDTEFDALQKRYRDRKALRDAEIGDIKRLAAATGADPKVTQGLIDEVNRRYKDPKAPATKAFRDDAATTYLQRLREQEAAMREQLGVEVKLTDAQKERAKFEQRIADLKGKDVLTAEQKSLLANQDAIRAQLDKNAATSDELKLKQDLIKLDERGAELARTLAASEASRVEQFTMEESTYGLGDRVRQQVEAQAQIRREYQRYQMRLAEDLSAGALNSDQFRQREQELRASLDRQLALQSEHFNRVDELRGNWELGFKEAYQNYVDEGRDAFRQAGDLFSTFTGGMEDAIANFVETGKFKFRDLANTMIAELVRVSLRTTATNAFGFLGKALGLVGAGLSVSSGFQMGGAAVGGNGSAAGSLEGFLSGARAGGGPTSANAFYEVNERGPELYTTKGRTFLMSGGSDGYVTPVDQSGGSAASGAVTVHNYGGRQIETERMSDGEIRVYVDRQISKQTPRIMASQQHDGNSPFSKAQSRATTTRRNR